MSKKLFISLTPLLAVVALAMPAAAAAFGDAPHVHWFLGAPSNASRLGEGGIPATIPTISWGTLELASEKESSYPCEFVAAGDVTNPGVGAAGPNGIAETESFASFYGCNYPECPASSGLEKQVKGEGLPWPSELGEETVEGKRVIRDHSKEVEWTILCVLKGKYEGYPALPTALATRACAGPNYPEGPKALSNGELDPQFVNGTSSTVQSRAIFTGAPYHLECGFESEPDPLTITERLKTITYEHGALYTAD